MTMTQRIATFLMAHLGLFALIFLLAAVQTGRGGIDPATERLEQAEATGQVVLAGAPN